jgi:D-alanyl-D-alanine-carboxypeptidase/D-alanyl-D-alanine-endopeptidase
MAWAEQAARSLAETFEGSFDAAGVAVAAAAVDGADTVSHRSGAPPDGRFEIGSVTKTMTATLLALLAADGTLNLDDEAGRWLRAGPNGAITLRQLATHTSGLPAVAPNFRPADPGNYWAAFTAELAEEGLRQAALTPGRRYSNFGYQLLGLVLERAADQSYTALVADRLLVPLSMTSSGVGRAGGGTPLPGHAGGREVRHWDRPMPGAGGVEASIGDLARYAQACVRPPATPLGAALIAAQVPEVPIGAGRAQALGWIVTDGRLRGHSGGTGGFSSCVIVDPGAGTGVALLVSSRGYGEALAQAARLALAGDDPHQARPRPPGPEWEERARAVAGALVDGRTAEVHAGATAKFRGRISAEEFADAWGLRIREAGAAGEISVSSRRQYGLVTTDVTIGFAERPVAMRIGFLQSGEIAGFRFLPAGPDGAGPSAHHRPDHRPRQHHREDQRPEPQPAEDQPMEE